MIATEPGMIYAELDAQDKLLWDQQDPAAVARIERELLRRSLNHRLEHYRIIQESKQIVANGLVAVLRERYGG